MINALLLASGIYLTPTIQKGGEFGVFGLKYTQKITDRIYFKVRVQAKPLENKDPTVNLRVFGEFDF